MRPVDRALTLLWLGMLVGSILWRFTGGGQIWIPAYPF
jgi:hypothetical protein